MINECEKLEFSFEYKEARTYFKVNFPNGHHFKIGKPIEWETAIVGNFSDELKDEQEYDSSEYELMDYLIEYPLYEDEGAESSY